MSISGISNGTTQFWSKNKQSTNKRKNPHAHTHPLQSSPLQIGLRVRDWVRVRLSHFITVTFSTPSFLHVADQQRRMLNERYSQDRSQPTARDKEFKMRSRTQSRTRSRIWRSLILQLTLFGLDDGQLLKVKLSTAFSKNRIKIFKKVLTLTRPCWGFPRCLGHCCYSNFPLKLKMAGLP